MRIDWINILIVLDLNTRQIVTYQAYIKKPKNKQFNKANDSSWLIFVMNAIENKRGLPKIFHSDRGETFIKYKKFSHQVLERFNWKLKDGLENELQ